MAITEKQLKIQTRSITNCLNDVKTAVEASSGGGVFSLYKSQDIDEVTTGNGIFYIGKIKTDGTYLIERITKTSATEEDYDINFANLSNNLAQTTYSLAWANRLTLTYGKIETLTNL